MVRLMAIIGTLTVIVALPAAQAADQVITGTVAPMFGVSFGDDGRVIVSGTTPVRVTTEQRGDTTVTTVIPVG